MPAREYFNSRNGWKFEPEICLHFLCDCLERFTKSYCEKNKLNFKYKNKCLKLCRMFFGIFLNYKVRAEKNSSTVLKAFNVASSIFFFFII